LTGLAIYRSITFYFVYPVLDVSFPFRFSRSSILSSFLRPCISTFLILPRSSLPLRTTVPSSPRMTARRSRDLRGPPVGLAVACGMCRRSMWGSAHTTSKRKNPHRAQPLGPLRTTRTYDQGRSPHHRPLVRQRDTLPLKKEEILVTRKRPPTLTTTKRTLRRRS
jgi:hypothetical protein